MHILLRGFESLNVPIMRSAIYNFVPLKCIELGLQLSSITHKGVLPDRLTAIYSCLENSEACLKRKN